jgi:hypothetical protein
MAGALLPPDGWVRISTRILYHKRLPASVRDTYCTLRPAAWAGQETPELSWSQIEKLTRKDRATVYRHMLTLVNIGAMLWRTASVGTIIVTFTDGIGDGKRAPPILKNENSQKREMTPLPLNPKESSDSVKNKRESLKTEESLEAGGVKGGGRAPSQK